jgi:hypothetical protein
MVPVQNVIPGLIAPSPVLALIVTCLVGDQPNSCWGQYRNVAVVQVLSYDCNRGIIPKMLSRRAKGVLRIRHLGHHSVGKTDRCAYRQALKRAEQLAYELNNAGDAATVEDIIGAGGSA